MNIEPNPILGDLSTLTPSDREIHSTFVHLITAWWHLSARYNQLGLPPSQIYDLILQHIETYTSLYYSGAFLKQNAVALENDPDWHMLNFRYGNKSIVGSLNEYYTMIQLMLTGHTVNPCVTKQEQTTGGKDFTILKPGWDTPVTCQCKSVLNNDRYGNFTRTADIFGKWSKVPTDRIYISDDTHTFWSSTGLFREKVVGELGLLNQYSSQTSLWTMYNHLLKQRPSFDGQMYGMFEKRP